MDYFIMQSLRSLLDTCAVSNVKPLLVHLCVAVRPWDRPELWYTECWMGDYNPFAHSDPRMSWHYVYYGSGSHFALPDLRKDVTRSVFVQGHDYSVIFNRYE